MPRTYVVHITIPGENGDDLWERIDSQMATEGFRKLWRSNNPDELPALLPRGYYDGDAHKSPRETSMVLRNALVQHITPECIVLVADGDTARFSYTPGTIIAVEDLERR